jgi:hypothetical protein
VQLDSGIAYLWGKRTRSRPWRHEPIDDVLLGHVAWNWFRKFRHTVDNRQVGSAVALAASRNQMPGAGWVIVLKVERDLTSVRRPIRRCEGLQISDVEVIAATLAEGVARTELATTTSSTSPKSGRLERLDSDRE